MSSPSWAASTSCLGRWTDDARHRRITAGHSSLHHELLRSLFAALCALIFMLSIVLVVIWMERKVSADIQSRIGPIRTGGLLGFVLQSLADALKLLLKEDLKPRDADRWPFYIAPYLVFVPAFMAYLILPFSATWIPQDLKVGILFYSAISAVPVLGIAMAGWSSNNKWSLLGGLRAAAQLISYEIPLALAILAVVLLHGSLQMSDIVYGTVASLVAHAHHTAVAG